MEEVSNKMEEVSNKMDEEVPSNNKGFVIFWVIFGFIVVAAIVITLVLTLVVFKKDDKPVSATGPVGSHFINWSNY